MLQATKTFFNLVEPERWVVRSDDAYAFVTTIEHVAKGITHPLPKGRSFLKAGTFKLRIVFSATGLGTEIKDNVNVHGVIDFQSIE